MRSTGSAGHRIPATRWTVNGSANNRQKVEVVVDKSRLLLVLNVAYWCRYHRGVTRIRGVRVRSLTASCNAAGPMSACGSKAGAGQRHDGHVSGVLLALVRWQFHPDLPETALLRLLYDPKEL